MKKKDLLLVIDMQNVYKENQKWACTDTEGAAKNICRLLDSHICDEVIFTRFLPDENPEGVWKEYNIVNKEVNEDVWANEMIDELKPWIAKYPLYTKSVYSSLAIPEVLDAARRADRVLVAGVVSECCVLSTVMSLIDVGIYTIYLKDCCSGLTEEKDAANELVLSGLSPLHVSLTTVDAYLKEKAAENE